MTVYSACVGYNWDLFPAVLRLHVPRGSTVADVTYAEGHFWRKVDVSQYNLLATDLLTGVDLRHLPYKDATIDALVLDPPYSKHKGQDNRIQSFRDYYNLDSVSGRSEVMALYQEGGMEAYRVLRSNGCLIVKCQDEIEGRKPVWNHVEIMMQMEWTGFRCADLFILLQRGRPPSNHEHQFHARKLHSYFLVFHKGRGLVPDGIEESQASSLAEFDADREGPNVHDRVV